MSSTTERLDSPRIVTDACRRRGFTLIELAIVLAIVAGIAGLIWAGASDVNMTNKVRLTNVQLVSIAQNIRTLFVEQGGVRGRQAALTPALDRLKVFPLDMRQDQTSDAGIVFHLWSQTVASSLGTVTASASDCGGAAPADDTAVKPCFSVFMLHLPRKACVQLLTGTNFTGVGVQKAIVGTTDVALPTDTNTASTACASATDNTLQWVYVLRDKS